MGFLNYCDTCEKKNHIQGTYSSQPYNPFVKSNKPFVIQSNNSNCDCQKCQKCQKSKTEYQSEDFFETQTPYESEYSLSNSESYEDNSNNSNSNSNKNVKKLSKKSHYNNNYNIHHTPIIRNYPVNDHKLFSFNHKKPCDIPIYRPCKNKFFIPC